MVPPKKQFKVTAVANLFLKIFFLLENGSVLNAICRIEKGWTVLTK